MLVLEKNVSRCVFLSKKFSFGLLFYLRRNQLQRTDFVAPELLTTDTSLLAAAVSVSDPAVKTVKQLSLPALVSLVHIPITAVSVPELASMHITKCCVAVPIVTTTAEAVLANENIPFALTIVPPLEVIELPSVEIDPTVDTFPFTVCVSEPPDAPNVQAPAPEICPTVAEDDNAASAVCAELDDSQRKA